VPSRDPSSTQGGGGGSAGQMRSSTATRHNTRYRASSRQRLRAG
jgi:hypothetical protein